MQTHKINFSELEDTKTPVLDYCRYLLSKGLAETKDRLEVFRTREEPDLVVNHIGKASKLTVKERPIPHFAKYEVLDEEKRASLRLKGRKKLPASVTDAFK